MSRENLEAILRRPGYSIEGVTPSTLSVDHMGAVGRAIRKPDPLPTLEQGPQAQPRRKGSVAVVCQIVSLRHRVLDSDNSAAGGNKALKDSICQSLAIDDGSETIRFEYAQCHTSGPEGTIVRIAWL